MSLGGGLFTWSHALRAFISNIKRIVDPKKIITIQKDQKTPYKLHEYNPFNVSSHDSFQVF